MTEHAARERAVQQSCVWLCGRINAGDRASARLLRAVVYNSGFSTIGRRFGRSIHALEGTFVAGSWRSVSRLAAVGGCASHFDQNGRHRHALRWGRQRCGRFARRRPRTRSFLQQEDVPSACLLPPLHRHAVGSNRTGLSLWRSVQSTYHPFRSPFVARSSPGDH